jgi:ABC-2 type transport system permease protein
MGFFNFWMAQDLGRAVVSLLLRGFTLLFIYSLIFDLAYPTTIGQWLALALAVVLSWLVSFAWRFLVNLAAFWSPDARGIGRFAFVMSWFFSGFLMPLRLYPDWVVRICNLTPFPHMLNTVVEVYLGVLQGPELIQALLIQALWVVGLVAVGQLVLRAAVRRLVILGG